MTDQLRDQIATVEWEILEQFPVQKRSELGEKAYEDFVEEIFALNTEYTWNVEDIIKTQFHPKDIIEHDEAFSFMEKVIPSKKNAFLFTK